MRFVGAILLRVLSIVLTSWLVAGCSTRPGPELLTPTSAPPGARQTRVVVATTRERAAPDVNVFTTERAQALNFAEFKLEYTPQKPDGTGDTAKEVAWNIAENVPA